MRRLAACFFLFAGVGAVGFAQAPATQPTGRPRLIVIITVDQMRTDFVDRFSTDWTSGLKRLVSEGAWFRQAAYPYLPTWTCAGHATIGTGNLPRTHGIIQNAWWDRGPAALTTCTQDPAVRNIGYGIAEAGGESARLLETPTFADVMRRDRASRVVSLSLKARSAIMPAGRGGVVTWANEEANGWVTSSAYAAAPVPEVQAFVAAHPIAADFGKTWELALPVERYHGPDNGEAEAPPLGWTALFPHPLTGKSNEPDMTYYARWQRSPFADAYLGRFASGLVESLRLGMRDTTDVLAVSFSTPDLVGHAFGPRSREVQDIFVRLDATIGALLNRLDTLVGKDRYVVALSSDHGVAVIPEQLKLEGKDAGRLDAVAIRATVEQHARAILGAGSFVARVNSSDVYFQPGVYAKLAASADGLKRIADAVQAMPGVAAVFRSEDARDGAASSDPLLRAAALGYFAGRSGDLLMVPKPGWVFGASGSNHGTASPDDQRVPLILMGYGIKPGQYTDSATPADIAPTLAVLAGVTLPASDGRPLLPALKNR